MSKKILKIKFYKYHGNGNDFIMIDNLNGTCDELSKTDVKLLCDRNFGIGSDGLILICKSENLDFEMKFFNPDASSSFCGNGARCAVAFAQFLGINNQKFKFSAFDGTHEAFLSDKKVTISIQDVQEVKEINGDVFVLNTGSPHYISYDSSLLDDFVEQARKIRHSASFLPEGINVNVVSEIDKKTLKIKTFERGVENETLACGTGIVASALSYLYKNNIHGNSSIHVISAGGELLVQTDYSKNKGFENIYLTGNAELIFEGVFDV
ncbi:MAG: diaminopimelate epimerase [Crocinitomicaceae bacterium]|nr:diaminopimelate epimerase [Crocinitomicaceae bacterium]